MSDPDFEFMDAGELAEALDGTYGEEMQEQAAALLGVELTDDGWVEDVLEELGRLEHEIGRNLTSAEALRLAGNLRVGDVPDFVDHHAEELSARPDEKESRMALMAERVDDLIRERDEHDET